MSLLLEALKKAELAKQGSKPAAPASPALELAPTSASPEKPVITRQSLPDIDHQQLEILSADLPSSAPSQPAIEMSAPRPAPPPTRASVETVVVVEEPVQEQAAAKQLFEAKGLEDYNPRKPFYYTVGALGVFAVGTVLYFWWQLQPRYVVAPTAVAGAPARTAGAASPPPAATAAPTTPVASAPLDPLAASGPGVAPAAPAAATPAPVAATAESKTPAKAAQLAPSAATPAVPAAAAANNSATSPLVISRSTPAPRENVAAVPRPRTSAVARAPAAMSSAMRADQHLERAYDAYQKGDLVTARQDYQEVLKLDPSNRDALLGLAAIAVRAGEFNEAEARYLRLLEADPRDAHAMAGLIGLRGQADPMQSESRLKGMIANQPEAGFLHFALGNQMAAQARWAEAQESYFKAVASDPDSPDYTYNLAVSLDHLRQTKPALEYYQKALALGGTRPSTFDRSRAATRIRELQQ